MTEIKAGPPVAGLATMIRCHSFDGMSETTAASLVSIIGWWHGRRLARSPSEAAKLARKPLVDGLLELLYGGAVPACDSEAIRLEVDEAVRIVGPLGSMLAFDSLDPGRVSITRFIELGRELRYKKRRGRAGDPYVPGFGWYSDARYG